MSTQNGNGQPTPLQVVKQLAAQFPATDWDNRMIAMEAVLQIERDLEELATLRAENKARNEAVVPHPRAESAMPATD
jgi:hypothetical protein